MNEFALVVDKISFNIGGKLLRGRKTMTNKTQFVIVKCLVRMFTNYCERIICTIFGGLCFLAWI